MLCIFYGKLDVEPKVGHDFAIETPVSYVLYIAYTTYTPMNNILVKFIFYLDLVKMGREGGGVTKMKIIPGTFKILTQCLPGIYSKFSFIIPIFHFK
jgi:hypothetical protein